MLTVDGSEKTQLVPQKQRKNTCMTIILLLTIITVGGGVYHGMINGGYVIDIAYGDATLTPTANLTAGNDAGAGDRFGHSVSVYNNTAVIGAYGNNDNGSDSGSAYIFERNADGSWPTSPTANLTAGNDAGAGDRFGYSVSVYNNTAVIGAHQNNDDYSASGSAYVFERNADGSWPTSPTANLTASDAGAGDWFGYSVSVYSNTAVIGAYGDDDNDSASGSAYVFEYSSGTWTQKAKLVADDAEAFDWFGRSVSVYSNTAVIGAHGNNDNGTASGSAYVFERNADGSWPTNQTANLTAGTDAGAGDRFGYSVSVYSNTAVIGAYGNDDNGSASGSAYVFERNADGSWPTSPTANLTAGTDAGAGDRFGYSVSVYSNTAVIGAHHNDDDGSASGSAYIFERNADGSWPTSPTAKLTAGTDAGADDWFGRSVSVYSNTAVIGAHGNNDNGTNSGSAYAFSIDTTAPEIVSASVTNATSITVTYNDFIDVTTTSGVGFQLSKGTITANTDPGGTGNSLILTVSGITTADTPIITYYVAAKTVVDDAANAAASQTFSSITDDAPPTVASAATSDTTTIKLTLSEHVELSDSSANISADFTLSGDITNSLTVSSVSVFGNNVTLGLSGALDDDDTISVAYAQGSYTMGDVSPQKNSLASFAQFQVANNLDTTAPTVDSAATSDTTTIKLTLSEDVELSDSSANISANFTLSGDITNSLTVSSVSVSENIVTLGLDNTLDDDDTISVAYAQGSDTIDDVSANSLASFAQFQVANNLDTTAPTVDSAATSDTTTIKLTLSEDVELSDSSANISANFTLSGDITNSLTVSSVSVSENIVTLGLDNTLDDDDTISVAYAQGSDTIDDVSANSLASFRPISVTNNLDTTAPTVDSAATSDTTTIKLTLSEDVELSSLRTALQALFLQTLPCQAT